MSAESSAPVFVPLPSVMASVAFCRSCNGRSSGQRFPLTAALASVVVLLLSALQVSGQNATAMLLSSAENCTNANGEPQFCAPWPPATSILDDVDMLSSIRPSVTATSTCDSSLYNETDMFCGPTGCEQFCPNGTSIENLLMGQGVMTGLGWMSEPTANDTQVIVDIDLGRVYVLLELTLVFPNATVPELFRVERSSSNTAVGSASFSVVPSLDAVNASSDETVMTTTLADDIKYNGYLATANGIALVSQNLATRHVRIVFMQPGMDSNVTDSTTGTSSSFYALSEIRLRGLCQCNGHALACNNSVCQCEHSTTGVDCSTCDTTDSLFVTSAQYSVASRASGANSCQVAASSDDGLSTRDIILIAALGGGGGLLLLILLIVCCCCCVKRRRKQGYVLKEEITVIDATGLRQVTIRNRGFHDDNGFGHSESTFKS